MKTLSEVIQTLRHLKADLRIRYQVDSLGIFGSYVRNEQDENSDIDILITFSEPISLFRYMDLEEELEQALDAPIDLVMKKGLKEHIGKRILSEVIAI